MTVCTKPPPGWHCTREEGHEGPCAAEPLTCGKTEDWCADCPNRPENGFELEEEGIEPLAAVLVAYAIVCLFGALSVIGVAGAQGWTPPAGAAVGGLGANFLLALIGAAVVQRSRG